MQEIVGAPQQIDVPQVTSMVVHSFRLSRGKGWMQGPLLDYAGDAVRDQISDEALAQAFEPTYSVCQTIFESSSKHLPFKEPLTKEERSTFIYREVEKAIDHLKSGSRGMRSDDAMSRLIDNLIACDAAWLPESRVDDRPSVKPYTSNIARYAILGCNSGAPVFDQMFLEVRDQLPEDFEFYRALGTDARLLPKLQKSLVMHTTNHPQDLTAIQDYLDENELKIQLH